VASFIPKRQSRLNRLAKIMSRFSGESSWYEIVAYNHTRYVTLQLLTAERAWASAMSMKAAHSVESKGISGKARSHIVSRLEKGAKVASKLADALAQTSASGASNIDVLEARAYASLLGGAAQFEKQSWEPCLKSYSVARIIYSTLSTSAKADIFKDLLSETIDPSIRYAAYQLKIPRTQPIPSIAQRAFPRSDNELVESIKQVDSSVLSGDTEMKDAPDADTSPSTITWRKREVTIEDAAIAAAWSTVSSEKAKLVEKLSSSGSLLPKDVAAAYDDILTATQDAVDATKHAIDELKGEGVQPSDRRMQSLQITRTAVTYEMISWRIGRNRVLMGEKDGATQDTALLSKRQLKRAQKQSESQKEEAPGRRIARLKEKVVLYDGTLQSLESIQELPGVAADEELSSQIEATINYFEALK
jgi:signal recognition particle subunit SRP68